MIQLEKSGYVTGVLNMASSSSKKLDKSYIDATVMGKKNYHKSFTEFYEIPNAILNLKEIDKTFEDILIEWLDNKKLVKDAKNWVEYSIGASSKVYAVENEEKLIKELERSNGGISEFEYIEKIYFIEFKRTMVCLMLGHNE